MYRHDELLQWCDVKQQLSAVCFDAMFSYTDSIYETLPQESVLRIAVLIWLLESELNRYPETERDSIGKQVANKILAERRVTTIDERN